MILRAWRAVTGNDYQIYFMKKWTHLQCGEWIGEKVERKAKSQWLILELFNAKQHPEVSDHITSLRSKCN